MFTSLVPPCWLARAKKRSLLLTSSLLLLVLYSFAGSAQTPGKTPTASISGRGDGYAGNAFAVNRDATGNRCSWSFAGRLCAAGK